MSVNKDGGPGDLPAVQVNCPSDAWDNMIREMGVEWACEWFGHEPDSGFTKLTIEVLRARGQA